MNERAQHYMDTLKPARIGKPLANESEARRYADLLKKNGAKAVHLKRKVARRGTDKQGRPNFDWEPC